MRGCQRAGDGAGRLVPLARRPAGGALLAMSPFEGAPMPQSRFTIRPCTPADAAALSVLGQATFLESFTEDITGPDLIRHCCNEHHMDYYTRALATPNIQLYLAETVNTGAPIGYSMVAPPADMPQDLLKPGDIELKRIYVLSRYHGARIGQALMDAALDYTAKTQARRVVLGVYDDNLRAMRFYEKHGFSPIGRRRFSVGGQVYDDAVLARAL